MADEDRPSELSPAEAARARRRDHDVEAKARKGMRTGLAKQFKQILDAQSRRAEEAGERVAEPPPASAGGPRRKAPRREAGRPQDRQPR